MKFLITKTNKNKLKFTISIYTIIVLFCSCSINETPYSNIVSYYTKDTLKHRAALFLEQYAKYHYGVARYIVDSTNTKSRLTAAMFKNDTIYKHYMLRHYYHLDSSKPIMDADTITESFLKENIELAFDSWQKPWAKDTSFDDFCHYILPYRNGDEELTHWRKYLKEKYEHLITDSLKDTCSIREISEFLMRQIRKNVNYGIQFENLAKGFLTPQVIESLGNVGCATCANYATLVMRACGIPCIMIDMHWRAIEATHSSVLFPKTPNNPSAFRMTIGDPPQKMKEPKDSMATWRSWAYTYEVNKDLLDLSIDKNIQHDFSSPLTREDITSLVSQTYNIKYPIPDSLRSLQYLFLCRFNNWKWYPIREGKVYKDSVYFQNATIRQLYRLGYYKKGEIFTFGELFTITGNGQIQKYDMTGERVVFNIPYSCPSNENKLIRKITIYYWNKYNKWEPLTVAAPLWGFNEKTKEYKLFHKDMHGFFKPAFHLLQINLPAWTVLTSNELPRPIGFITKKANTKEAHLMQF